MINKTFFDYHPCGIPVYAYEISNELMSVKLLEYGATINSVKIKDKYGETKDVVGGFDSIVGYIDSKEFQGATVGRVCNRVKDAEYSIDGKKYYIYKNEGNNVCHSGRYAFNQKLWKAETKGEDTVIFHYLSPDGEEGFPGNLDVTVEYILINCELKINYYAKTDKKTIVNMTNHAYFNMNGYDDESVENHIVRLNADTFNETDTELIPTGVFYDVSDTPFDLREKTIIGNVINGYHPKLIEENGLDTNYILNDYDGTVKLQGEFYSPKSGIKMEVLTNQSSILIYSANNVKDEPLMKNGVKQILHFGACFEAESMPDSINHDNFDDIIITPEKDYSKTTIFRFSVLQ